MGIVKFIDATNNTECIAAAKISYFSRMANGCLAFKIVGSDTILTSYIGVSSDGYNEYLSKLIEDKYLDLSNLMFS